MKIQILCAGRSLKKHEQDWIDIYLTRIQKFCSTELIRIRERSLKTPNQTSTKTWQELKRKIPTNSYQVLLDAKGQEMKTKELLNLIQDIERRGKRSISFILGGSYGLPPEARESADTLFSLSKLTLPHRVALLILCEQIYRALTMKAGTPYHHE